MKRKKGLKIFESSTLREIVALWVKRGGKWWEWSCQGSWLLPLCLLSSKKRVVSFFSRLFIFLFWKGLTQGSWVLPLCLLSSKKLVVSFFSRLFIFLLWKGLTQGSWVLGAVTECLVSARFPKTHFQKQARRRLNGCKRIPSVREPQFCNFCNPPTYLFVCVDNISTSHM